MNLIEYIISFLNNHYINTCICIHTYIHTYIKAGRQAGRQTAIVTVNVRQPFSGVVFPRFPFVVAIDPR